MNLFSEICCTIFELFFPRTYLFVIAGGRIGNFESFFCHFKKKNVELILVLVLVV